MSPPPSITCPKCQRTSYNANDIKQRYCGYCHEWLDTTKDLPRSLCPTCGYHMDAATCVTKEAVAPKADDFSLCMKCGEILVFNPDLTLRAVELNDLTTADRLTHLTLERGQKFIRQRRPLD